MPFLTPSSLRIQGGESLHGVYSTTPTAVIKHNINISAIQMERSSRDSHRVRVSRACDRCIGCSATALTADSTVLPCYAPGIAKVR